MASAAFLQSSCDANDSMSIVFGVCTFGLLLMTLRSIQVAIQNWRAGTSPLMAVHDEGRHQ